MTIDTEISKLKRLNLIAGALHLVSLLAILLLANDAKLPVNAIYLTEAPGTGNFSDPINLFNLKIGYMVAGFLALSAFFHFLIISPAMFGKYTAGLKNHINVFRWVEYSLSSTIMIIVILQLNGTADYIALMGIAGVNICMILFGWLQEKYTTPGDGDLLPFWFGCIAGIVPWIAMFWLLFSPGGTGEAPGFVYGVVFSLFIFFNSFALVQWLQYKKIGRFADYLVGERTYITLSFIAKSALAWQIFGGVLATSAL